MQRASHMVLQAANQLLPVGCTPPGLAWPGLAYRWASPVGQLQAQVNPALEEELGDAPDEFLDPIMSELMRDPVTLPTSNTTMDRCGAGWALLPRRGPLPGC
jgi:hypothetical protein